MRVPLKPAASSHSIQPKDPSIRIKNIKAQQNAILQKIYDLALTPTPNVEEIQQLRQTLSETVATLDKICSQEQATPANLTSSSLQIYSWMKFLTNESNLQLHLTTTYHLRQVTDEILTAYNQKSIEVIIALTNFAGLYKRHKVGNTINVTVSEGFINAPKAVLLALMRTSILGKCKFSTRIIRAFASKEEYTDVLLELDLIAQVDTEKPQGKFYNLDDLFNKINHEYFNGILVKPRLTWSGICTYRKFGHYEPDRDRVVISLTLDNAGVPQYVTEFVLYHELLHKYHGDKWVNGKRMAHTPEFRRNEKKFNLYEQANRWLSKLSSARKP